MNYPNIILYPLLNRIELLKSIIKNFIPFSFKQYQDIHIVIWEILDLNLIFTADKESTQMIHKTWALRFLSNIA